MFVELPMEDGGRATAVSPLGLYISASAQWSLSDRLLLGVVLPFRVSTTSVRTPEDTYGSSLYLLSPGLLLSFVDTSPNVSFYCDASLGWALALNDVAPLSMGPSLSLGVGVAGPIGSSRQWGAGPTFQYVPVLWDPSRAGGTLGYAWSFTIGPWFRFD